MKHFLFAFTLFISANLFGQYSDTISCNGGLFEYVIDYDQQTCPSMCNGSYTITVITGVGPYVYTVNGPAYSSALSADINLCVGTYSVDVTDQGQGINCNASFDVFTLAASTYTINTSLPSAFGQCDGSANISVAGGVPPITYQWYDQGMNPIAWETSFELDSMCAGTYYVQYWDNTPPCGAGVGGPGAGGTGIIAVVMLDPVVVTLTASYLAPCPGGTGTILYTVSGGTGNYIDPYGGSYTTGDGGSGIITVCDDAGNCGSSNFSIPSWPGINMSVQATSESCPGACDGSIIVNDNWIPSLDVYSINGGPWQSSPIFSNLCPGDYEMAAYIPDASGSPQACYHYLGWHTVQAGTSVNNDGDAWSVCDGDCDDNDPSEYPGVIWYTDADGDGYGDPSTSFLCERNHPTDVLNNLDCDDSNPAIYPGATELECNGTDDDCNPLTTDDSTVPVPDVPVLSEVVAVCEVTPNAPTANDNCSGTLTGVPDVTFPITILGTSTITWTFDDGNGNSSSQTQDVTISGVDVMTTIEFDQVTITAVNSSAAYQWLDCTNGFAEINGATSQSFTPSVNGDYAVILTENGCIDTSSCVTIGVIGVEELNAKVLAIYPNPVSNELYVHCSESCGFSYRIIGVNGSVIKEGKLEGDKEARIAVSEITTGSYLLELTIDGFEVVKRFVKE